MTESDALTVLLYGGLCLFFILCIVGLPLWLAISDRFLGTNFYGDMNDD